MNWTKVKEYEDIFYEKSDGIAKVTINRPHKRNAFRPLTVFEMFEAFTDAREDSSVGVVLLTGAGPHSDGKYAFCSGGDQSVRGKAGYVGGDGVPRLNVLDLQKLIRSMPKVVIALVSGYAIGGGHVLHVICDLSIAADNAIFGQTGPKVGSFDGGFGSSYLARIVGQKKAREIWYLCRQYNAQQALKWAWSTLLFLLMILKQRECAGHVKSWRKVLLLSVVLNPHSMLIVTGKPVFKNLLAMPHCYTTSPRRGLRASKLFSIRESLTFGKYPWLP